MYYNLTKSTVVISMGVQTATPDPYELNSVLLAVFTGAVTANSASSEYRFSSLKIPIKTVLNRYILAQIA